ncbi:hypothetical protein CTAM01_16465 [Colletotrichum tamarilloi]|uniref:Uncharacterized protein n=1 Tax=Colletotrichum tamarilloi TaxID=1209934 RepID=A0ABQ9QIH1_9PEZI|nr:uncharacterized protein CTAM01_16465 [Colletotrichum tamarilloi]KAK1471761.1 hypothetical protein CTAM01_16465 [Colletotrichum tamarilloi]
MSFLPHSSINIFRAVSRRADSTPRPRAETTIPKSRRLLDQRCFRNLGSLSDRSLLAHLACFATTECLGALERGWI